MGSIAKRPNGKYRARYRDPEGKEHARHFTRRKDAQEWLSKQVVKVTDGTWVDPERGRRTFGEYAQEWQAAQIHHRASTRAVTTRRLERINGHFADRPLSSITRKEVQGWVSSLEMSPASVEAHYRLLAQVLLAAVEEGKLAGSPCRKINLPSLGDHKPTIPSLTALTAIAERATPHGRPTILLAAGSGLRVSELLGLTVDRVDFLRGVITVDRQLIGSTAGQPRFGPPKTRGSVRKVPIPRELVEVLAAHLAAFPSDGLVFKTRTGFPWTRSKHADEWRRWCRLAGHKVRFHDLRHLYAASLIAAGQSVKVVQERLGHASAATTLDIYSHLFERDDEATREAVSERFGDLLRTARGPAGQ